VVSTFGLPLNGTELAASMIGRIRCQLYSNHFESKNWNKAGQTFITCYMKKTFILSVAILALFSLPKVWADTAPGSVAPAWKWKQPLSWIEVLR
jgi:hypothetical protein